ncbi:MAG TPA: NAD-dependent epimerase/dehydratase family protein [Acidimicrobiales bacterium]|nr:NAD-dependent epimerase/dehydratase family protein [Acidimicrobiales bacterium]
MSKPDGGGIRFWHDRPVLVTGATGLLGSSVVDRLLCLGAQVTCLVRDWVPKSELVLSTAVERCAVARGDVTDQALVERVLGEYEVRTVLHLAAQTVVGVACRNPVGTFQSNVLGTVAVLEACRRSPTVEQVVLASSDKAYGSQPRLPYTEDMPLSARHPYDASKACADLIARSFAATYGLPVGVTRCGNLYGPGDLNWNRIVPGSIRAVLRDEPPVIRSDGTFVRDYVYVEDGAAATTLLAERLAVDDRCHGQAFNFSTETPLTVIALVELILELMGSAARPVILDEASNEIRDQHLCAAKAREMLGWAPRFDLVAGLTRTIAWYEKALAPSP